MHNWLSTESDTLLYQLAISTSRFLMDMVFSMLHGRTPVFLCCKHLTFVLCSFVAYFVLTFILSARRVQPTVSRRDEANPRAAAAAAAAAGRLSVRRPSPSSSSPPGPPAIPAAPAPSPASSAAPSARAGVPSAAAADGAHEQDSQSGQQVSRQ